MYLMNRNGINYLYRFMECAMPNAGKSEMKIKLVRDSFTMPKLEYAQIAGIKQRAAKLGHEVKKSEVLRAAVALISGLSDDGLLAALKAVPSLKTGRPKREEQLIQAVPTDSATKKAETPKSRKQAASKKVAVEKPERGGASVAKASPSGEGSGRTVTKAPAKKVVVAKKTTPKTPVAKKATVKKPSPQTPVAKTVIATKSPSKSAADAKRVGTKAKASKSAPAITKKQEKKTAESTEVKTAPTIPVTTSANVAAASVTDGGSQAT